MDGLVLSDTFAIRVRSLRTLVDYDGEVEALERQIHRRLADHAGYQAIQALDGWAGCSGPSSWPRSAT